MREKTERPEGVEAGAVKLVGTDRDRIVAEARRLMLDPAARAAMIVEKSPYGDGLASRRIVEAILLPTNPVVFGVPAAFAPNTQTQVAEKHD
jgi:UDP-N-acetylglucosamine 2-epimerase (non-hydrolysing)